MRSRSAHTGRGHRTRYAARSAYRACAAARHRKCRTRGRHRIAGGCRRRRNGSARSRSRRTPRAATHRRHAAVRGVASTCRWAASAWCGRDRGAVDRDRAHRSRRRHAARPTAGIRLDCVYLASRRARISPRRRAARWRCATPGLGAHRCGRSGNGTRTRVMGASSRPSRRPRARRCAHSSAARAAAAAVACALSMRHTGA